MPDLLSRTTITLTFQLSSVMSAMLSHQVTPLEHVTIQDYGTEHVQYVRESSSFIYMG
jgi:hypothetical protein